MLNGSTAPFDNPHQHFCVLHLVRDSKEPGWLEGTLNGKTGLIPSNYVEFIWNLIFIFLMLQYIAFITVSDFYVLLVFHQQH